MHWIDSVEDWRNAADGSDRPHLLVVDDSASLWQGLTSNDVDDMCRRGHHVVAAVTPSSLRARPDHPLHTLRRHRSGLVLGPSAHADVDLLGVFDLDLSFVEPSVGRGWFVDRGEVIDLVQIVRPAEGAP